MPKPSPSKSLSHLSEISPGKPANQFTFQSQCQSNQQKQQSPCHSSQSHSQSRSRSQIVRYGQHPFDSNQYGPQDKDNDTDQSDYREQLEKQYKMRLESVMKGYELKFSREQETFQLKEMKYHEEIQYLKRQIKELCTIRKDLNKNQGIQNRCSICSNGQVVTFMKNMLQAVQNDHRGCLSQKTVLNAQIIASQQKTKVLQIENEQSQQRYQKVKIQLKQLKAQKQSWQRQKRQKQRQYRQLQRNYQVKQLSLEQQSAKHKMLQKQLQSQIKKIQQKHIDNFLSPQLTVNLPPRSDHFPPIEQNFQQQSPEPYISQPIPSHNYQQFFLLRPSLKQNVKPASSFISASSSAALSMKNSHIAASIHPSQAKQSISNSNAHFNWKAKMEQSYVDYANSRRKGRKENIGNFFGREPNNKEQIATESFETFRPAGQIGMVSHRLGSGANPVKYSYLQ